MADRTPDGLGLAHSEGNPEFSDSGIGLDSRFVRKTFQKFRILVVGKANSGKTTLLKKFCMSDEEPVVRDMSGRSVSSCVITTTKRGLHDINHEISYPTSPGFVFHDSRGFESGGTAESKILYDFLENRSRRNKLHERIHAVWFCIPAGQARALGAAELEFFKHSAHGIPVIVIFTKWDVQIQHAINFLRHQGKTRQQAKEEAARFAEEYFARQLQDIQDSPNPPKSYVYLRDMDKDGADCAHLATVTAEALDDEVLRTLFVSKQLVSSKLSAEYAMRYGSKISPYFKSFIFIRDIIPYGAGKPRIISSLGYNNIFSSSFSCYYYKASSLSGKRGGLVSLGMV
ncbi:hypothetical protein OE88DRAFT_1634323 [Heliocybe sulcata]|uniref:Uncharacterized protein n=1 Tax=Heliocybe sulcata TaxID=5364 RepID=A0A5C3MT95_9AGAM|nr:hypothetical protein OE88DRAFT_1634323 [Heliocybe sulcata]